MCEKLHFVIIIQHMSYLDVNRIVVFAKEYLDLIREYRGAFLNNEINIPKCDVLNFRFRGQ